MIHSKYLVFERREPLPGRKTPTVLVESSRSGDLLGRIAWYGPWRQFCFYPEQGTIFNNGCMDDIIGVIAELREEHHPAPWREEP